MVQRIPSLLVAGGSTRARATGKWCASSTRCRPLGPLSTSCGTTSSCVLLLLSSPSLLLVVHSFDVLFDALALAPGLFIDSIVTN